MYGEECQGWYDEVQSVNANSHVSMGLAWSVRGNVSGMRLTAVCERNSTIHTMGGLVDDEA
jgi:hypothetical protein